MKRTTINKFILIVSILGLLFSIYQFAQCEDFDCQKTWIYQIMVWLMIIYTNYTSPIKNKGKNIIIPLLILGIFTLFLLYLGYQFFQDNFQNFGILDGIFILIVLFTIGYIIKSLIDFLNEKANQ